MVKCFLQFFNSVTVWNDGWSLSIWNFKNLHKTNQQQNFRRVKFFKLVMKSAPWVDRYLVEKGYGVSGGGTATGNKGGGAKSGGTTPPQKTASFLSVSLMHQQLSLFYHAVHCANMKVLLLLLLLQHCAQLLMQVVSWYFHHSDIVIFRPYFIWERKIFKSNGFFFLQNLPRIYLYQS